jgi:uncharacterized membrane protein
VYDLLDELPTEPVTPVSELPTKKNRAISDGLSSGLHPASALSTSLPMPAPAAFDLFCDMEAIPQWMPIIRSARVLERDVDKRAVAVAFLADLERATMGYTLHYRYRALVVEWSTTSGSSTNIRGRARFQPAGDSSCLLHYQLSIEAETTLPAWKDPMYNGHAASAVVSDFRSYVDRRRYG